MQRFWLAAVWCALASATRADEKLAGIACRSVHLGYAAPAGLAFYNETAVLQSARGTYFCVCGFNKGYFGIQELGDGKKVVIFSVWEPGAQNNPNIVAEERRTKCLFQGEGVRVNRFGGEGTGGQSFFDFDWKPDAVYRFLVTAEADGERTAYTGHFYLPDAKQWKKLVTFSTLADGKKLGGYYSFVEDFRRNRVSATEARKASFGNGWVKPFDGPWQPLLKARFTADGNPATNIDAGLLGDRFFLSTGGSVANTGVKLNETITRPGPAGDPPADLPAIPPAASDSTAPGRN